MSNKPTQPALSARIQGMPRSNIHLMSALAQQVDDPVSLSWAKPASGTPAHINAAAIEAINAGHCSGYSPGLGLPALREAICAKLKRDNGITADPTEILVTVGAIEGITAALAAVIDPGDEVILPSPNYSTHTEQVRLFSGQPVWVPCIEDESFRLDLDALSRSITGRTRAILFSTPVNPTGAVFSEADLRAVGDLALKHNLVVLIDEAYEYITFDGHRHFSLGSVDAYRDHVISIFTLTKTYAMTGWRLGYLHAPARLIPEINKAHNCNAICAPVVSQYAGLAAINGPQDCVGEFNAKYAAALDKVCGRLDALGDYFAYQRTQGSYCIFPRVLHPAGADSLAFCQRMLAEARVSTTPGCGFGTGGEQHLRITFCCALSDIDRAFDRIEPWIREL
ncbi:aminotransferase class I/II-fold pyridoxal phosphate-dependent enzyme [bacterium]|nr:aminotransferase class I/II-fold pyridoxal phosphate-dependent enzyme [bacterium]